MSVITKNLGMMVGHRCCAEFILPNGEVPPEVRSECEKTPAKIIWLDEGELVASFSVRIKTLTFHSAGTSSLLHELHENILSLVNSHYHSLLDHVISWCDDQPVDDSPAEPISVTAGAMQEQPQAKPKFVSHPPMSVGKHFGFPCTAGIVHELNVRKTLAAFTWVKPNTTAKVVLDIKTGEATFHGEQIQLDKSFRDLLEIVATVAAMSNREGPEALLDYLRRHSDETKLQIRELTMPTSPQL